METQGHASTTCILLDFGGSPVWWPTIFLKKHLVSRGSPCRLVPYDVMKKWIPRSCNLTSKPDVPWWQKPNISKSYVFDEGTPKSSIYYLGIAWFPTFFLLVFGTTQKAWRSLLRPLGRDALWFVKIVLFKDSDVCLSPVTHGRDTHMNKISIEVARNDP